MKHHSASPLTVDEVRQLLAAAYKADPAVWLRLYAALRRHEVAELCRENIDLDWR